MQDQAENPEVANISQLASGELKLLLNPILHGFENLNLVWWH